MPLKDFIEPIRSSKTLGHVFGLAMLAGAYAVIPTVKEYSRFRDVIDTSSQYHAVLSLILGCLLVFRTNTAYSRWWEARTLWGALVNACRNAALKFNNIGEFSPSELQSARRLLTSFPVALCYHLRGQTESHLDQDLQRLAGGTKHVPLELARQLYEILGNAQREQRVDGDELRVLDAELLRLMDICGGCERILKTRIVKSYRVFARQCVLVFLATLPWGIVHDFRLWTVPFTIILAYFMLGLETVAEHVEEPFGYDEDDLRLDELCDTIRTSVDEVFSRSRDSLSATNLGSSS